jgi:hypothetical protein
MILRVARSVAAVSAVLSVSPVLTASIWHVDDSVSSSGDGKSPATAFKRIQQGIHAASGGDKVIVAEGNYFERIHFPGKNIILSSTNPLSDEVVFDTIIDGDLAGTVVTFDGTETGDCVVEGFTIRDGKAEHGGGIRGGMAELHTQATIRENVITGNVTGGSGGGLPLPGGVPLTVVRFTVCGSVGVVHFIRGVSAQRACPNC